MAGWSFNCTCNCIKLHTVDIPLSKHQLFLYKEIKELNTLKLPTCVLAAGNPLFAPLF